MTKTYITLELSYPVCGAYSLNYQCSTSTTPNVKSWYNSRLCIWNINHVQITRGGFSGGCRGCLLRSDYFILG